MSKTDRSTASKKSKPFSRIDRRDKLGLIKDIHNMMAQFDYVSVNIFKESTERIASAFLRGRGLTADPFDELLGMLIQFSRRSTSPEAAWFAGWVKKVHQSEAERLSSRKSRDHISDLARQRFKELSIEIDGFGYVSASDLGAELYLGSLAGFYHIFSDSDSLRGFALGLIDAATEVESSRKVINDKALPDDYAETALADWRDQIVADAWLNPDKEPDSTK